LLGTWLQHIRRDPCPYMLFAVIDAEEITSVSPEIRISLQNMLSDARYDPAYLERMAQYLGWKNVQGIIAKGMPGSNSARRGEFAEALSNVVLEQSHGYVIPVRKLRFKITSGQSLPATDTLALKLDANGKISEVCYVESKLRSYLDTAAALDGCGQLQNDFNDYLPDMLTFISANLFERNHPLFHAFAMYMRDRTDTKDLDTFRLSLCWEHAEWNERVLINLEDSGIALPSLTVHVIRVWKLIALTNELFNALGIVDVSDGD